MKAKLKKISLGVLAAALSVGLFTACSSDSGSSASSGSGSADTSAQADSQEERKDLEGVERPTSIKMMADTIMTKGNGIDDVLAKYKEITGIELVVEKPDHDVYYETLTKAFSSGDTPDVIEIGTTYYPNFADEGKLWDMLGAYEKSEAPVKSIIDENYIESLEIDGKLYGFPAQKGGGTVTYVRGDWMEEMGIENPKNYDEFIEMLRKFKERGEDIIPITAAGAMNSESPYNIFLREFYQDANPDFYKNSNSGRYVDGMTQPEMKDALQRLQDAHEEGLLDREIVTNDTSKARNKFFSGNVGCFNYWAGNWSVKIEEKLHKNVPEGFIKALTPIKEANYIERPSTAYSITDKAENKIGIYKFLIEFMHDGGEGQMLFTHGVEGIHWAKDGGKTVALPSRSNPDSLFDRAFFDPELSVTKFDDPISLDPRVRDSLDVLNKNSTLASLPYSTNHIEDLDKVNAVKKEIVNKILLGERTVDEGIEEYKSKVGDKAEAILDTLNG